MKSPRWNLAAACVALALASGVAAAQSSAKAGEGNRAWIGLFTEKGPEDMAETRSLEKQIGKRFASLMWFTDFEHPFPAKAAKNAAAAGAVPNITWEPWFWSDNGKISLADINAGTWDAYITEWGKAAAKFGKPLFIRWGHEFNGDWYPWSVAKNGQDPKAYIAAYRRVHDLVVRAGAKKALWVWCPNSGSVPASDWNDPLETYPGDGYVDWIAIDGYDFDGNASFSDIFSKSYAELIGKFGKPIYIGEFATGRTGSEKAAWLKEMDASLGSQFPGIKGIVYFSVKKERDWRLDDSAESLAGAKDILSKPGYDSRSASIALLAKEYGENYSAYKKASAVAAASIKHAATAARLSPGPDGKPDWSAAAPVAFSAKNGLGGSVRFAWDPQRLYLRADLKSLFPLSNQQKDDGIWNGGCLELCVSTDPKADPARLRFTAADWQLGFAPADESAALPARSWEWNKLKSAVPEAEVSSRPAEGGYVLEASFPWKALRDFIPEAGMTLGFDFAVDDAGADGKRAYQWIWNGNTQFYNSPAQWGTLRLAP
jgi:hypothetical protein